MATTTIPRIEQPSRFGTQTDAVDISPCEEFDDLVYQCRVAVVPDGDRFVATAIRLPELTATAASIGEAVDAIKTQFADKLAEYRQAGKPIPLLPPSTELLSERCFLVRIPANEDAEDLADLRQAIDEADELVEYDVFRREELGM
ncbi:MAG: hypothetical protein IH991_04860 [Planctomycetes bacterium]|nr:hypothetical protein [Planctomycetota bacterium]